MMKRQHVTMLEHIEHAGKCKAPAYKEPIVEPKQARAPVRRPQEFVQAPVPTAVRPPPPPVQPLSSSATSISVCSDSVLPWSSQEPDIPAVVENPLAKLSLKPHDKIMTDAPAMQQEQKLEVPHTPVMSSQAGPSSQGEVHLVPEIPELKAQPAAVESCRLSTSSYALDVPGPTKHHPAQLLFMHAVSILAPPPQFAVVVLTTDPRTLEQYDGLVATQQKTVAMSKGKEKAVATVDNESNYGQSLSEDEQESEEGESATQRFQCMQQNKKLASKKANIAKARDAQQHRAINDFSGRIPNGLGVKVWGPNNVEQLNSCFRGALGGCMYYSPYSNTVHIGANANQAAAFKHNLRQWAKVPATIVYKYAPRGLSCTPYELERLYKYYANEHVPHCNCVVAYMLISALLLFAQQLDNSLQDCTMQVLLSDPLYWDLKNPI
ncbi:hypothetical protein C0995_011794 [Termitomyces sp. Mi166|nr:hypothetical protein C0995_011794 [Termitomyces sp. Mi166\